MPHILHRCVTSFARSSTFDALVRILETDRSSESHLLHVLTYHRVDDPGRPQFSPSTLSATPEEFEQQVKYLAENCSVISMEEAIVAIAEKRSLPARCVLITLDDGYLDLQRNAWPILRKAQLPATVFVATDYPDRPEQVFWWDRLHRALHASSTPPCLPTPLEDFQLSNPLERGHARRQLERYLAQLSAAESATLLEEIESACGSSATGNGVLGWDALRRLHSEGLTVCPHTQSHRLLNRIPLAEVRDELVGSMRAVQREIGAVVPAFSYPGGQLNDHVLSAVAETELKLAFTTRRGVNSTRHRNPLRLRRINVGRRTNTSLLRAQLLPFTRWLNPLVA